MIQFPDELPVLSAGNHRRPQDGACFMEWASVLAGEAFSDHPACTHPVLASIARVVNDGTTDAGRGRLAPLIPSVVGTTCDDPRIGPELVALCCRTALLVTPRRQHPALSVALRRAERRATAAAASVGQGSRRSGALARFADATRAMRQWGDVRDAAEVTRALVRVTPLQPATDDVLRQLLIACIERYHDVAPAGATGAAEFGGTADRCGPRLDEGAVPRRPTRD